MAFFITIAFLFRELNIVLYLLLEPSFTITTLKLCFIIESVSFIRFLLGLYAGISATAPPH